VQAHGRPAGRAAGPGAAPRGLRIGVDIGGTFTDVVLADDETGALLVGKVLTTPAQPDAGVVESVREVLGRAPAPAPAARVAHVVHGTTLFTNALIERRGARTALIATRGFRDAVEIGREHRYDMYDLFLERPAPLAPRALRFEVDERMLADGTVARPLDPREVARVLDQLSAAGVEAVAVCLLHSYRNPAHEQALGEAIRARLPRVACALSSDVVPEVREYERASTTLANVYVQRLAARYLGRLRRGLDDLDLAAAGLFIMQSNGGVCSVETAGRFPVRVIESGPAAGALAAAHYGRAGGYRHLLSFDMGGTTAKACLVDDREPLIASEFEVDRRYRFKRGSGLPIKVPVIEMIEIGAGGGSIARIDRLGRLVVGPESAGADPGPACYGRGGAEPTVTDADLVLGYLDPAFFLGGALPLDREAALAAIAERIAAPLGIDPLRAAWAIHRLVNENMAAAARVHATERGKDIERFPLFAFGGAGPVHAYRVAAIARCPSIVYPLAAGLLSAVGLLAAPLAFDFARTLPGPLAAMPWAEVNVALDAMADEGRRMLEASVPPDRVRFRRFADMRYRRQGHEIRVPIPAGALGPAAEPAIRGAFETSYAALYGRTVPGVPVDVMTWRVVAEGPAPGLGWPGRGAGAWAASGGGAVDGDALKGRRRAYMPELDGCVDVPVYDRYRLAPGRRFDGPAIVEERESTAVLGPGARARVDDARNLVVERP
jgi:N-methylhydantoinase A